MQQDELFGLKIINVYLHNLIFFFFNFYSYKIPTYLILL